jgi:cobalt/nickel transport system permease protein
LVVALLTGGALSWFASANPDGLEWSIEKVFGKPELPEQERGIASSLKKIQEKTAFLPDYSFRKPEGTSEGGKGGQGEQSWPAVEPGTSASGILGSALVLSLILLIGLGIRFARRNKTGQKLTNNDLR